MRIIKAVFQVLTHEHQDGTETYHVMRNYKNGNAKVIGRTYKTKQGALGMVRHRNSLIAEKHGTHYIKVGKRY